MRRRLVQLALGTVASGGFLLLTSQAAYADNCGSFTDCFDTTGAAIAAAVLLGLLIALGIGLGAIALEEIVEALAEAAAEGFAEGAGEAVGEMAGEASVGAGESAAEAEAAASEAEEAATEAQSAVESAENDPNKLNHIFGKAEHNWDMTGLDQQGNLNLIQNTLQNSYGQLPDHGVFQVTQNFGNYAVTVRGAIVNGVVRIGSAWVNVL